MLGIRKYDFLYVQIFMPILNCFQPSGLDSSYWISADDLIDGSG